MVSCMKIDFTKPKQHLVITQLDIRLGFNRLAEITLVVRLPRPSEYNF